MKYRITLTASNHVRSEHGGEIELVDSNPPSMHHILTLVCSGYWQRIEVRQGPRILFSMAGEEMAGHAWQTLLRGWGPKSE